MLAAGVLAATGPALAAGAAPGASVDAPVLRVIAPVRDILVNTADLRGEARVEVGPKQITVRLDSTVLFAKDSPRLRPAARARLREVAAQLSAKGPGRLLIIGYTDDLGSAQHGLVLSRRRAQSVAAALRPQLPAARDAFTVLGRGEADPVVRNDSESHRRVNRRVELRFTAR